MNLSKKFQNILDENPISKELRLLSKNIEIDLTISNPLQSGISFPKKEILNSLKKPDIFKYSPNPKGSEFARTEIQKYYFSKNENTKIENIFLTTGTSEGFSYLLKLLTDPGDDVILPSPGYPLHEYLCMNENVAPRKYPLRHLGLDNAGFSKWEIDFQELKKKISKKTKAIVLVSPNNPTGFIPTRFEIDTLCDIANQNKIPIIVDEVFSDYIHDPNEKIHSFPEATPVFYLNGISKTLGLSGLKLSWIRLNSSASDANTLQALEFISDSYLSVNAQVQYALKDLFSLKEKIQSKIKERLNQNISIAENREDSKFTFYKPKAGWYGMIKLETKKSDEEIVIRLLEKNILTHPGYLFDLESEVFLIVSLLTEERKFRKGLKIISSQK
ncbi:MAG: pyridoxal phosphate-dependent aminotransferase [Leptospiraceae bacterium]|nr:pyridoxal phosphate-dependent aminotransferase [Leptospiraceae bacterium]MCK6380077.1 pyridoxal phosphate-dependent aminotransferase [Leptospiraceae bacterium]NUM40482.1 pyridoxal phosphate-dependent aminotransferase [Leptospiraceae bacterium]